MIKSWRDTSEKSPAHRYDIALTDEYAPKIQRALLDLLDLLDVPGLIDRYGSTIAKAENDDVRARLIESIMRGIVLRDAQLDALTRVLEDAATEGAITGTHAAIEQLGAHAVTANVPLAPATVAIDWDRWKPGDTLAVGEVVAGALRENLEALGITVRGISDTVLDTIGNHIGDGLLAGHGSDKIEREIRDLIGSRSRAERIAHTEVARAQTTASMIVYESSGVTEYDLLISDGACVECIEIADENPYQLDDDTGRVPIHPFCRCADAPRIESIDPSRIETRDPDGSMTVGDDAPAEPDAEPGDVSEAAVFDHVAAIDAAKSSEEIGQILTDTIGIPTTGFEQTGIKLPALRDEVKTIIEMAQKYPSARFDRVDILATKARGENRMAASTIAQVAQYRSSGIQYLQLSLAKLRNPGALEELHPKLVETGHFHAIDDRANVWQYAITHEFGHIIDGTTKVAPATISKILRDAQLADGHDFPSRPKTLDEWNAAQAWRDANISGYGQGNRAEMLAEAFADYEVNGALAKPLSQALHDAIVKGLE